MRRTVLLLIGLIVSPVSFAGEKQLTCLYLESLNPHSKGLMGKGAWRTDKIIFNTDELGLRTSYRVNRALLTSETQTMDEECSIGDVEVLRGRAF